MVRRMDVIKSKFSLTESRSWLFLVTALAIAAGFILTLVSWAEICTSSCQEAHNYRLFGMKFELMGFLFFGALGVIHALSLSHPQLKQLVLLMVSASFGAELWFILAQKYLIGSWCPICLGIAASVFVLAAAQFFEYVSDFRSAKTKEETMKSIWRGTSSLSFIAVGFIVAFLALAKPDPLLAAQRSLKESIAFGNLDSPIEVYVFTDWKCPACRAVEPTFVQMAPDIEKEAKLFFIDLPIHRETLNFTPYNLSFMINNKDQYFDLRNKISALAQENDSPSDDEVETAIEPLGAKYTELSFADVSLGAKLFKKLAKDFSVKTTPTVVVVNTETKKGKKFSGTKEVTEENIMNGIASLKQ